MEPVISASSIVAAAKAQVSCNLEGEAAILHLDSGVYYGLDPVGARIWRLVQAPTAVSAVLDALRTEYDVDPEQCERDLVALLQDLVKTGLVDVRDGPAAPPR